MSKKIKLRPGPRARHGGWTYLRSGELPEGSEHIEKFLTWVREGYIRDIGPKEEDLSTGQVILLNDLIICIGFCRLIEEKARKEKNPFMLKQDHYLRFKRHARQLCLDLGIKRKAKDEAPDIQEFIKEFDEEKKKREKKR